MLSFIKFSAQFPEFSSIEFNDDKHGANIFLVVSIAIAIRQIIDEKDEKMVP